MKKRYFGFTKKCLGLLLTVLMLILQTGCSSSDVSELVSFLGSVAEDVYTASEFDSEEVVDTVPESTEGSSDSEEEILADLPIEGEYYYDVENVVLYLYLYDELPDNYMTKSEAEKLGWEGGSVEKYKEGAAIGGDRFGNREGLLPKEDGRSYTECDIDTDGAKSRGAKRLVFSNDGLYYYTEDHYESFDEVTVTEDYEVIW